MARSSVGVWRRVWARRAILCVLCVLCVLGVLFAVGCGVRPEGGDGGGVYITPKAGNGISLAQPQQAAVAPPALPSLYTAVPDDYVISEVINHNLDEDITAEQLVLYKHSRSGDYLQLLVIDYDRRRDSYIRAWEEGTAAQNTNSIEIGFVDLTGDGREEILISGRDQSGNFTLDVFRVNFTSQEAIITLTTIGTFISESTIGVEPGSPPRLVTEETIVAVSSPTDTSADVRQDGVGLRLRTYRWSQRIERFQLSVVPVAANPEIDQQFFQRLVHAPVGDLLQLTAGVWRARDESEDVIMIVDNNAETLSIHVGQRQVIFRWRGEFKTVANGFLTIQLTFFNENIPSLTNRATITLSTINEIRLHIQGQPALSRVYYRAQGDQPRVPPSFVSTDIPLNGWYEGVFEGGAIAAYFHASDYIVRHPTIGGRGTFIMYELDGESILELSELDSNRLPRMHQQYLIDRQQRTEGTEIIRAIELTPVTIDFYTYRVLGGSTVQLVQAYAIRR